MKNRNKIMKEIKAVGLRVKVNEPGLTVYPNKENEYLILTSELRQLIAIAQKYNVGYYINFDLGYVRLH